MLLSPDRLSSPTGARPSLVGGGWCCYGFSGVWTLDIVGHVSSRTSLPLPGHSAMSLIAHAMFSMMDLDAENMISLTEW